MSNLYEQIEEEELKLKEDPIDDLETEPKAEPEEDEGQSEPQGAADENGFDAS